MRPTLRLAGIVSAFGVLAAAACARPHPLRSPQPSRVAAPAPDSFLVQFTTTEGRFVIKARRHWAPLGVDRFYYLVRNGFYDDARFFRVIPNFVAQFGIPADPQVAAIWHERTFPDDPPVASNQRGTVSFARGGRDTRSTQLFINLRDNSRLDTLGGFGFPPIGEVVEGMTVVDSLHSGYGEGAPSGRGPAQDSIRLQGSRYLERHFPALDAIRSTAVLAEWGRRRR